MILAKQILDDIHRLCMLPTIDMREWLKYYLGEDDSPQSHDNDSRIPLTHVSRNGYE